MRRSTKFYLSGLSILFIILFFRPALGYQSLTTGTAFGYSGNLYTDSFSIGDSYMMGTVSISDTEFKSSRMRLYYDMAYFEYDTRNSINRFDHLAGVSIFNREKGKPFKWQVDIAGTYRDYVESNTEFDNYRLFFRGESSYYLRPTFQLRLQYQFRSSNYKNLDILNHSEHFIELEATKTLPSRTTVRVVANYSNRTFTSDDSRVDWADLEFKLTQSLDIRTGVSLSGIGRVAGMGIRPLSSYYIISGITTYWDPWDGYQINGSLKRILPLGMVAISKLDFWHRKFSYSTIQQTELPWISGKDSREEDGWDVIFEFNRQFNIYGNPGRAVRLSLELGYISNDSNDPFYSYDFLYGNLAAKFDIF